MFMTVDEYWTNIDERHSDVTYNGGIPEDADVFEYLSIKTIPAY